jgi:hypothetical protein
MAGAALHGEGNPEWNRDQRNRDRARWNHRTSKANSDGRLSMPPKAKAIEIRFWERVDRRGPDECWPWMGRRGIGGYGVLDIWRRDVRRSKAIPMHRLSWEIKNACFVPEGLEVLHSCDNPPCVNPSHLFVGTQADNMRDMAKKGRARGHGPCGERSHLAKLKNDDVIKIRSMQGTISSVKLEKKLGISSSLIRQIWRGKIWKHLLNAHPEEWKRRDEIKPVEYPVVEERLLFS